MRTETKRALRLVVEKSHRLRGGRYVQTLQEHGGTQINYSWKREKNWGEGTTTVDQIRPDDEATEALVLTFRLFIQKSQAPAFRWLAENVLDDPGLSEEWRQGFTEARAHFNGFLDQFSGYHEKVVGPPLGTPGEPHVVEEHFWTNRQVMDIFINGGMAHAEPEKWEICKRWKSNVMGFPLVQHFFDNIIMTGLHVIAFIGHLSERELAAHEAASHAQE